MNKLYVVIKRDTTSWPETREVYKIFKDKEQAEQVIPTVQTTFMDCGVFYSIEEYKVQ